MTTHDVMELWERLFPEQYRAGNYPEAWVISMWRRKYDCGMLEHALAVTARAVEQGKVKPEISGITRYASGVLRNSLSDEIRISGEITDYLVRGEIAI